MELVMEGCSCWWLLGKLLCPRLALVGTTRITKGTGKGKVVSKAHPCSAIPS